MLGQIIEFSKAIRRVRPKQNTQGIPEEVLSKLQAIYTKGDWHQHSYIKGAIYETFDELGVKKNQQGKSAIEYKDKIREILRGIKWYEKYIKKCEEKITSGLTKRGTPLAESTLKQIKSCLKRYQESIDIERNKLSSYTEDEIREVSEKEEEDRAAQRAREWNRKDLIESIEHCEKEKKRYTEKLLGGIETHSKYRGQPLTEVKIQRLKELISENEKQIAEYREILKVKDKMGL